MAKITKQYLDFNGLNLYNEYVFSKIKQPDWNQNDETAVDYVKNRTHWIGDPELVTIIEETTTEIDGFVTTPTINFVAGQAYFINWNGTEYECTAWVDQQGEVYLGNGNIYGGAGNGEDVPFCFETGYVNVAEAGTYTFSITTMERKYYPIDERFLPPVIGRPGTGENAEVFNDYPSNIASGDYSHAEGGRTKASNSYSHAEGYETVASGSYSHAEGFDTKAFGPDSHAEGFNTTASGNYSHAEGNSTIASGDAQHVQGKNNIEDTNRKYAHIVGNGTSYAARSNAHTIDWDGNTWFAGKIYVGGTGQDDTNAVEVATLANAEEWVFTLEDGSTVTKKVVLG